MNKEVLIWLWEFVPATVALVITQCFTFVHLMESRFDKKKTMWMSIILVTTTLTACISGCWILGIERETWWTLITLTLPSLVFFFWISKYRDIRFWVTYCISDISIAAVDYLAYLICLLPYKGSRQFLWSLPVRCVACFIAAVVVYRFVCPNYAVALRELSKMSKAWWLVLAAALFSYVLMGLLASYPTPIVERREYIGVSIIAMILIEIMIVVISYMITSMLNAQVKSRQESEMALRLQLTRQQMDALRDSVEQTRAMRHNLRHQLQVMQMMCKEGNYDALQKYLQDGITNSRITVPQYCKNYVANLLLQHYATLAVRCGVEFRCHAILPEQPKIDDTALTTLLGNALSNALDAAQSSSDGKGKMELNLDVKQNTLVMKLSNTAPTPPKEKDGELISDKGEGHGYGFASLRHLVESAGGLCQWIYADAVFQLDVAFPLT